MADPQIDLTLVWHDGRKVIATVAQVPLQGPGGFDDANEDVEKAKKDFSGKEIEEDALESERTLCGFFEDLTRGEDDQSRVEAWCYDLRWPKLLKLLKVSGQHPSKTLKLPCQSSA